MRAILLHNPSAGGGRHSADELMSVLRKADVSPSYCSTKDAGFPQVLDRPADLLIVAGGDGTVAEVLTCLKDRRKPVAILPAGTANNIARSLGIAGSLEEVASGWRTARRGRFDVGVASGSRGRRRFVEAVGFGALARATAETETSRKEGAKTLQAGRAALRRVLAEAEPQPLDISLDGHPLAEDLLMVEVMNISHTGPGLCLAPSASAEDGLLDVVWVSVAQRREMLAWLDAAPEGAGPPASSTKVRKVTVGRNRTPAMLDDDPDALADGGDLLTIEIEREAACLLMPT